MSLVEQVRAAIALHVARPYIWRELPGWGRLYDALAGDYTSDPAWAGHGKRWVRGKLHGYEMHLDLGRWSNRKTYFLGRFYDLPTQLLLKAVLRPGDTFVDIGANEGMISLLAAHLVGPSGKVIAFEPNPQPRAVLEEAIARNGLAIDLRACGLADADAVLTLHVPVVNTGEGSFGNPAYAAGEMIEVAAPVRRGDCELEGERPRLIKIDVEGFETRVLHGLEQLLDRAQPVIVMEMVASHLGNAGSSIEELVAFLQARGYRGRKLGLRRAGLRHVLQLHETRFPPSFGADAVWTPAGDDPLAGYI